MRYAALLLALALPLVGCDDGGGGAVPADGGGGADSGADGPGGTGAALVQRYQCGKCHQSPQPADGMLSGQTVPVPGWRAYGSNLTPDPDTGMDAWPLRAIASAILKGSGVDGGRLCAAMPPYGDAGMTDDEAQAIALYLQNLPPVWHAVPSGVCQPGEGRDGG
jgi:hypothetical protein